MSTRAISTMPRPPRRPSLSRNAQSRWQIAIKVPETVNHPSISVSGVQRLLKRRWTLDQRVDEMVEELRLQRLGILCRGARSPVRRSLSRHWTRHARSLRQTIRPGTASCQRQEAFSRERLRLVQRIDQRSVVTQDQQQIHQKAGVHLLSPLS